MEVKKYILGVVENSLFTLRELGFLTQTDVKKITEMIELAIEVNKYSKDLSISEENKIYQQVKSPDDWDKVF